MKTITLVAFNRPDYLRRTLAALEACQVDNYTLFIGVEPGNREVIDLCRGISFMPTQLTINEARLGLK